LIHVWPIFPITPEAVASTVRIGRFLGTSDPLTGASHQGN
jgi:hypothetical protein